MARDLNIEQPVAWEGNLVKGSNQIYIKKNKLPRKVKWSQILSNLYQPVAWEGNMVRYLNKNVNRK